MDKPLKLHPSWFRILVVDDEPTLRSVLEEALGSWGFQVRCAASAEEALEIVQNEEPPHIILSDIRMDGMTGIDLAEKVKAQWPDIEVIIMTSHGSFETAVQAIRIGVQDYLSKPFDSLEDIRPKIQHVCERIYSRFYIDYLMKELKEKNREISLLGQLTSDLQKHLQWSGAMSVACAGLQKILECQAVACFHLKEEEREVVLESGFPAQHFPVLQVTEELADNVEWNMDNIRKSLATLLTAVEMPNAPFLIPCKLQDKVVAVFALWNTSWTEAQKTLLQRSMDTVSSAFHNIELHEQVLRTSLRDALTGLHNVRYFRETFAREILVSQRNQEPLSLLFVDLDHFKKYNDQNGHPAGDALLKGVAQILKKSFRKTDLVARYGGEEFVVLLTKASAENAFKLADRLRSTLMNEPFIHREKQPLGFVSASIGVAEIPSHADTAETLLKAADDALYEAKKTRNKVSVSQIQKSSETKAAS